MATSYIEAPSCDVYQADYDLEAEKYVPSPKGDVRKTEKVVQDITLDNLDTTDAKTQGGNDILSMVD